MPEHSALIAVLIMERPMCVGCIAGRSGLTHAEVESYLSRIESTVDVKQALDRFCFERSAGILDARLGSLRRGIGQRHDGTEERDGDQGWHDDRPSPAAEPPMH